MTLESVPWNPCQICLTSDTEGCHNDNLRCHMWRQSWHFDNSRFSLISATWVHQPYCLSVYAHIINNIPGWSLQARSSTHDVMMSDYVFNPLYAEGFMWFIYIHSYSILFSDIDLLPGEDTGLQESNPGKPYHSCNVSIMQHSVFITLSTTCSVLTWLHSNHGSVWHIIHMYISAIHVRLNNSAHWFVVVYCGVMQIVQCIIRRNTSQRWYMYRCRWSHT